MIDLLLNFLGFHGINYDWHIVTISKVAAEFHSLVEIAKRFVQ